MSSVCSQQNKGDGLLFIKLNILVDSNICVHLCQKFRVMWFLVTKLTKCIDGVKDSLKCPELEFQSLDDISLFKDIWKLFNTQHSVPVFASLI